jgi:hypothetical protein
MRNEWTHRERGYCTVRETLSPVRTAGDGFRRAFTARCRLAWLCPGPHRVLPTSAERGTSRASLTGAALVRAPLSAVAGFSPALPTRAGLSRAFTGVPSCSRIPLARGPVLGLGPSPPRRRRAGPVRFSFGTWAFTSSRTYRRRPPSCAISAVADPARDVHVRPRPQWGSLPNNTGDNKGTDCRHATDIFSSGQAVVPRRTGRSRGSLGRTCAC